MSAAVSHSGDYALTAHRDNRLILWHLQDKQRETVDANANVYSAQFIHGTDLILWQDLDDVVRVQSVEGEVYREFEHFPTYGHVMSEASGRYLSADQTYNIFSGFGDDKQPVLKDGVSPSFTGTGKILNLAVAPEAGYFISVGSNSDRDPIDDYEPVNPERRFSKYGGLVLWDLETLLPLAKLPGNSAKTHATISPDGQWVVSGDENGIGLFWNTENPEERHRMARYYSGIYLDDTPYEAGDPRNRDVSELIEPPDGVSDRTIASAFIHESEYFLRFGNNSHKAALFKAGNPWPQKYFDLGESPSLVTYGSQYSRNTAIATSPEAGVLVMGHRSGGGISVYEFDEETLELERVWVAR